MMRKLKKLNIFLTVLLLFLCVSGCSNINKNEIKTEYLIGEEAEIDNYLITINDYVYEENDKTLKVNLELLNKDSNTKNVSLKNDFEIYDINNVIINDIDNVSDNSELEVLNNERVNIELKFDVSKINEFDINNYKIIFYSRVATNNIAFKFIETK